MGFWLINLTDSFIIVNDAIVRLNSVLVLGPSTVFGVYLRNLHILHKNQKKRENQELRLNSFNRSNAIRKSRSRQIEHLPASILYLGTYKLSSATS